MTQRAETGRAGTPRIAAVTTHVAPATGFGGVAESMGRIVQAWAAAGRCFSLCSSDASGCSSDASGGPRLKPADLGLPTRIVVRFYRVWGWPRFGFGLGAIPALFATCRRAEAVYVNGIGTWPTTLAALFCLWLGRPMVVAPRAGLMRWYLAVLRRQKRHKWWFYRLLTFPALRRARALHLTSPWEAEGLAELLPGVPLVVIPNGLDLTEWPALPPRDSAAEPGLTFCYVGRLSEEKGILGFLRVWLRLRRPGDRFLIAGSGDGPYAAAVLEAARSAGEAVELTGYVDRRGVGAVLARSDLLVLPSGIDDGTLRESFGNAAAEALASARPVLVIRGLAWDAAESLGFGLLFDPDPGSVAAAIERAQSLSPEQRAAMGACGRRWAEQTIDIRQTAAILWRHLTGERTGDRP